MWQFVIRQEGGRCVEFCVSAANGWAFITKLYDVVRNLDLEVEVSGLSVILICLVILLSFAADSSLVRQSTSASCQIPYSSLALQYDSVQHPIAF